MTVVAVLMGGSSREREVSLVSGRACAEALKEAGYQVVEIDVGRDIASRLSRLAPDVCFNALHGPLGEDGSMQGLLNVLDIRYTHSGVLASALAMDKVRTKAIAAQLGIQVPAGRKIDGHAFEAARPSASYVLKPINDGSSINTFVVRQPALPPFASTAWPFAGEALLEELVEGVEVTVTVLGERPLTVTEIVPTMGFYDYDAKYTAGGSAHVIPANLPPESFECCLDHALTLHCALGCRGISRSDFIVSAITGVPVFLELNTQPGMTPTSLAPEQAAHVGIGFPDLMRILVEAAATD